MKDLMPLFIIFFLYQIAWLIGLIPFVIAIMYRHFLLGKTSTLKERCGFVPQPARGKKIIWLHAVSVGEVLSLEYVIKLIKDADPSIFCYVTTGTPGGKKMADAHLNADVISYLPYDFFVAVAIALVRIRPSSLIIVEAEIWPNLLMISKLCNVPLYALNARVSKRSGPRYRHCAWLLRPLFGTFTHVYAQSPKDKEAFVSLGIAPSSISVIGNIKICNVMHKKKLTGPTQHATDDDSLILLLGSVHPGEMTSYLTMFTALHASHPRIKLLIAPRHLNWINQLTDMLQAAGCTHTLWKPTQAPDCATIKRELCNNDVIVFAQLGILFDLYAYADIFFLGGTFVPIGGHNLMEPATWGVATIVGPYHHNSAHEMAELTNVNGIVIAKTETELIAKSLWLITDETKRNKVGQNAYQWIAARATTVEDGLTNLIQKL